MLTRTINDIQQYAKVYKSLEYDRIVTELEEAEEKMLIPVISRAFYNELNTALDGTPSPAQLAAIKRCQKVAVDFALALYIPKKGVALIGKEGLTQPAGGSDSVKAAGQYGIKTTQQSYEKSGWTAIELLLELLERNKASYGTWVSSSAYTEFRELIVYNTAMFQKWVDIGESRRLFKVLYEGLKDAQRKFEQVCGEDLFAEILTQVKAGTTNANNKKLLEFIEPGMCHHAIMLGLETMAIGMDKEGLTVYTGQSNRESIETRTSIDDILLMRRKKQAEIMAGKYSKALETYLRAKAATYPLYTPAETVGVQNDTSKSVFNL